MTANSPHPDSADGNSPEHGADAITPIEFSPLTAPLKKKRRLHPVTVIVAIALLAAALVLWFLLTARAIFFDTTPADTEVKLDTALLFQLSDSYLLRPGSYSVSATAEGYFPLQQTIEVSADDNQHFALQLQKKPGHLDLSSTPDSATVTVDGVEMGQTPLLLEALQPGEHQLEITAPRYFSQSLTVDIEGLDKTQPLAVELQPAWGQLSLKSSPVGASVFVSGEHRGVTPLTTELLEWGETVKLQLTGHKSWQEQLSVTADGALSIDNIVLEKVDGLLRLSSTPKGASVTINGKFHGQTPMELELKPDTTHSLSLFLNGYLTSKRQVTIASGTEQQVEVALKPETGELRIDTKPANTQVFIDGVKRGRGGDSFALPARRHTIEVRSNGYASQTKTFTPRPGVEQVMKFSLMTEAEARWAATPRKITTELGQELKLFRPEDSFTMGASRREPGRRANEIQREVILNKPFYIATKEVTNAEFKRFDPKHFSRQSGGISLSNPKQPVVNVSWEQAALFCNWLSAREGLPLFYKTEADRVTGFNPGATGYRLPTEAEWAWSARQADNYSLKFSWGNNYPPTGRVGNYADISAAKIASRVVKGYNDGYPATGPVGKFEANNKGLYDMGGNAAEWVNDYYGIEINLSGRQQLDPTGPETGEFKVIRGSSWRHGSITELRLSFRDYGKDPRDDVGFRIARYVE